MCAAALPPCEVSSSGRPIFLSGETELYIAEADLTVALGGASKPSSTYAKGTAYATSHRLVWVGRESPPRSAAIDLKHVAACTYARVLGLGGKVKVELLPSSSLLPGADMAKVRVLTRTWRSADALANNLTRALENGAWKAEAAQDGPAKPEARGPEVDALAAMGFPRAAAASALARAGTVDKAVDLLLNQEAAPPAPPRSTPAGPMPTGLERLRAREEQQRRETSQALGAAMTDLNALMARARDIVGIVESLSKAVGPSAGGEGLSAGEHEVMRSAVVEMGIVSPVTREAAGALFEQQLARELYDFLCGDGGARGGLLRQAGGLVPLTEAWYYFNRARGQEMVSPQDMKDAFRAMAKLNLDARLVRFEGGVLMVEGGGVTHGALSERAANMALDAWAGREGKPRGVGAPAVAAALSVGQEVARRLLEHAEAQGLLCRDDGLEGTTYFANIFPEVGEAQ
ncbi:unnamed protein product [Pedinophyceae sp. YPF-701]|nr:unnamed protein product [Pedinophyceae sp. YPF-701]